MINRLEKLRHAILAGLPGTNLRPLYDAEMCSILARHPDLPDHLRQLFTIVGVGHIGNSRYMIHGLLAPDEVYDTETARSLDGILLVGDDFSGNCDAYDFKRGWKFGAVGENGKFSETAGDFVDFLENWYGDAPQT